MKWTAELYQYQLLIVFIQKTIEIDISEMLNSDQKLWIIYFS